MESSYTTKGQLRSSLQRVVGKIELAEDKIDVLSGVANGITARIEGAEGDISSLQTQVDGISVPTKTSDLTNDSGYIKSINEKSANATGAVSLVPPDIGAASNPSLFINGYFADPINQRGQTEYTENGYSIDGFMLQNMSGSAKISIQSDCIRIIAKNNDGIIQRFERKTLRAGETLTCSVLTKSEGLLTSTFVLSETTTIKQYNNSLWGCVYGIADDGWVIYPAIVYNQNNVKQIDIIAVKLERGPRQTLAHKDESGNWVLNDPPPDKVLELMKCQKYYIKTRISRIPCMVITDGTSLTSLMVPLKLPVPMRINKPAITQFVINDWISIEGDMYNANVSVASVSVVDDGFCSRDGNIGLLVHLSNNVPNLQNGRFCMIASANLELDANP